MRSKLAFVFVFGGAFLAGCAPKPIPDWAMHGSAQSVAPAQRSFPQNKSRTMAVRVRGVDPTVTGTAGMPIHQQQLTSGGLTPFSAQWYAQEKEVDERIKRRMRICGSC